MSHDAAVLRELLLLAGVALVVLVLFRRLRLPATIGFIVTGVLVGPGVSATVAAAALVAADGARGLGCRSS